MKFTANLFCGIIRGKPKYAMANLTDRLPNNAPGPFYVDATCTDCDFCRSIAPDFFRRDNETGYSYVYRQPVTPAEFAAAREALTCPTDSIGEDGRTVERPIDENRP